MSYIKRNAKGEIEVSREGLHDLYNSNDKDSVLMDILGELDFACGKTRWDKIIKWTHLKSRDILITVTCPKDNWEGAPNQKAHERTTQVHLEPYEIHFAERDEFGTKKFKLVKRVPDQSYGHHWIDLPYHIRQTWAKKNT